MPDREDPADGRFTADLAPWRPTRWLRQGPRRSNQRYEAVDSRITCPTFAVGNENMKMAGTMKCPPLIPPRPRQVENVDTRDRDETGGRQARERPHDGRADE